MIMASVRQEIGRPEETKENDHAHDKQDRNRSCPRDDPDRSHNFAGVAASSSDLLNANAEFAWSPMAGTQRGDSDVRWLRTVQLEWTEAPGSAPSR